MEREFRRQLKQELQESLIKIKGFQEKKAEIDRKLSEEESYAQNIKSILSRHQEQEPKPSLAGMGFRDAVRNVMRDYPGGMTSGDIRKHLLKRGFEYELETPLTVRLSNELNRMRGQKMVDKVDNQYRLTDKGRSM